MPLLEEVWRTGRTGFPLGSPSSGEGRSEWLWPLMLSPGGLDGDAEEDELGLSGE